LSLKGDPAGAERSCLASLDLARRQRTKSRKLRTAISYARPSGDRGRLREACDLLPPVYAWFTEGFGTKDLKEAKALLEELGASE
jgi:predicted ATPase